MRVLRCHFSPRNSTGKDFHIILPLPDTVADSTSSTELRLYHKDQLLFEKKKKKKRADDDKLNSVDRKEKASAANLVVGHYSGE